MEWVLPFNSYLVSGFTILFFNFFVFAAVKTLAQSICASANLRTVYDLRQPLEPRRSRLATLFGGPTGPPRLARLFAVLIALLAVLVVTLDFAVSGSTAESFEPTKYRSLVRAGHDGRDPPPPPPPKSPANAAGADAAAGAAAGFAPVPLAIDYKREYRVAANGTTLVSRRLFALVQAHGCLELNVTHHTMFAYAFRDIALDYTLVPLSGVMLRSAECVTSDNFATELPMHSFRQVPELDFTCNLTGASINLLSRGGGGDDPPGALAAEIRPAPQNPPCDLRFRAVRCFKFKDTTHCGAVASSTNTTRPNVLVLRFADLTNPHNSKHHEMREVSALPDARARRIAANMAFFSALGFPDSMFNMMYMAVSRIDYNVTLDRVVRKSVSEVNVALAAPVLAVVAGATVALAATALAMWVRFVYRKNRRKYVTFSSVEEILVMVRRDGLTKSREGDSSDQVIFLRGDRPVLVQDSWF